MFTKHYTVSEVILALTWSFSQANWVRKGSSQKKRWQLNHQFEIFLITLSYRKVMRKGTERM